MKEKGYKTLSRLNRFIATINFFCIVGLLLAYTSTFVSPAKISLIAFFGLLYPAFLFANTFFLVYWILKRKKLFLLSLITILIGYSHLSHFVQLTITNRNDPNKSTEFTIMSYNVRLFDLYNWTQNKQTRNQIFDFLSKEDPEVICFQEFYHQNETNDWQFPTRDTLIQFLKAKNFAEGYTVNIKQNQFFGLITLSKFPIINHAHFKFNNDKSNSFLYTDLKINEDTIRIYNAHIGSARFSQADYEAIGAEGNYKTWPHQKANNNSQIFSRLSNAYKKRSVQTDILLKHTNNSPYPLVLCGDFNDTPVSYNYKCLTKNFCDAFTLSANGTAGTYCSFPMIRIDYILHSKDFNSFNFKTHKEQLSDHRAISTVIEY